LTELGTITYEIEPWNGKVKVVSQVWNTGMFGAPQWFRNEVAICNTEADARILIEKIDTKKPGR
jgi:hypothetical protein